MTARLRSLLLSAPAGLLLALPASALAAPPHDDPIAVTVTLDPAVTRTGDQTKLRVAVTHPARTVLQFPDAAAIQSDDVEVIRTQPGAGARALDGSQTTVTEYVLAGFAPGVYALPDLKVGYQTADGEKGTVVAKVPQRLTVESVLANTPNASLRDIKPPLELPRPPGVVTRPLATSALAAAAVLLALLIVRRLLRHRRITLPLPVPALTPEATVRRALDQAAAVISGPAPDYAAFYTTVSTAVRDYLERRTNLPVRAFTTRELRRHMEISGTDRWHARIILGLLDECDAVKWAHYAPDHARADRALTMAYEVVELVAGGDGAQPPAAVAGVAAGANQA